MGNDMNILLLYTMTAFDSFGQEPIKTNSVQDERLEFNTSQAEDVKTNNEVSVSEQKKEQDVDQRIESTKYIEGLSPQDNDMIQLMLDTEKSISHEQRLLSNIGSSTDTEVGSKRLDTSIGLFGNSSSDLFNFATVFVIVVLFLLGIMSYFFRRKSSDVPEMRMVSRSMFGAEGSLAIVALEHNSKRAPKYILLGLNNGAAPRLIMELPSYNESSEKSTSQVRKSQNPERSEPIASEDLRDVLSRANFSNKVPQKEPLRG